MSYNLSPVENATDYADFFAGVDTLVGGLYVNTFVGLVFLIVFISVEGETPVKAVLASFSSLIISVGLFFSGVGSQELVMVTSSLLFLSLLWKINQ